MREAAAKKWFGEPAPPWDEPCDIYLYDTAQDYSLATGRPPQVAGHSSFQEKNGRVVSRRIDLHCDDPNVFIGVLPHETTHVVLAGRFGAHRLPHWADEGMAVLSEPRDRVALHLNNLPRHRQDDELFPVAELMQMDDYPDVRRIGPFYAESVSLVSFLSAEKGPKAFARFLRDGLEDGYESALKRDYGINNFDDLQDAGSVTPSALPLPSKGRGNERHLPGDVAFGPSNTTSPVKCSVSTAWAGCVTCCVTTSPGFGALTRQWTCSTSPSTTRRVISTV